MRRSVLHRYGTALALGLLSLVLTAPYAAAQGGPTVPSQPEELIETGRKLLGTKRHPMGLLFLNRAIQLLSQRLAENPGDARSHFLLGQTQFYLNQDAPALASYRKAIKLSPKTAMYHARLGLLLSIDDPEGGVRSLERAAALAPENVVYRVELSRVLVRLKRVDRALAELYKAIELSPNSGVALFGAASLEMRKGNAEKALALYVRTTKADPRSIPAWYNAGLLAYRSGDFARAESLWASGLRASPEHFELTRKLIQALYAQGKVDQALVVRRQLHRLRMTQKAQRKRVRYCIDQLRVGPRLVLIYAPFEAGGAPLQFDVIGADGKAAWRLALTPSDGGFTLTARRDGKTLRYPGRWEGPPAHADVKARVKAAVEGTLAPVAD